VLHRRDTLLQKFNIELYPRSDLTRWNQTPEMSYKATNRDNNGLIQPPIPLTCPEEDKKSPEDTLRFELLSTLSKPKDSPTYEAVVNVFCNGTPEEYI
jgi:hypothetical protein